MDDWQNGARGWVIWVSLAALLADASVQLTWFLLRSIWRIYLAKQDAAHPGEPSAQSHETPSLDGQYRYLQVSQHDVSPHQHDSPHFSSHEHGQDNGHRPSQGTVISGWLGFLFLISVLVCTIAVHAIFGSLIPWYYTVLAIALSLPMAVVGIRSLAETDHNPGSALGKSIPRPYLDAVDELNTALINCSLAACVCHPDTPI